MRRISTLAVLLVVAAPAFARADTPQQLPDGANIAGVTVGGMDATGAEAAVRAALEPVYDKRPVAIRAAHHDELVTPEDYSKYVDRLERGEVPLPRVAKSSNALSEDEILGRCREIARVFSTMERWL